MKRLFLVRHAKSSWKDHTQDDIDRPLNGRGKRDAPDMANRLSARGIAPDLMVSSPAVRAYTTAKVIARTLGYPRASIARDDALYLATPTTLLEVARSTHAAVGSLMLFGHNPGMTEFSNQLGELRIDNLPTCGIVCADFEIDAWSELRPGAGRIVFFDFPKNLPSDESA